MPMITDTLISCLTAVPSLVHLKLEPLRLVDMNVLFSQLEGDTTFLPKLESIHVFFSADTGRHCIYPGVVASMLRWRWDAVGVTQLRSFQMAGAYRNGFTREEAISDFKRLEEEGMDLYLGKTRFDIDSFRKSCYEMYIAATRLPPSTRTLQYGGSPLRVAIVYARWNIKVIDMMRSSRARSRTVLLAKEFRPRRGWRGEGPLPPRCREPIPSTPPLDPNSSFTDLQAILGSK
ncbi:hypothetical protein K438DRAFT_1931971 [Mycena galopus ATCC 62051]|nr:hypothetical protein K438DRAFT_1931971 [Mycena galopus ATCC 62051]